MTLRPQPSHPPPARPVPAEPPARWQRRLAVVLLLAALALFGWVAHATVWTNVAAERSTDDALAEVQQQWRAETTEVPAPVPAPAPRERAPRADPAAAVPAPAPGSPFAVMRIPRLDADWVRPVIEGSGSGPGGMNDDDLRRGVVHYPATSMPGTVGNFAVAGHRAGDGEPFRHLERLRPGDEVTVTTAAERMAFRVQETRIVAPEDGSALLPVPFSAGAAAQAPSLTLSTCHPRLISTQRLVVVARLVERVPVTH